jgi:hypothetical protein
MAKKKQKVDDSTVMFDVVYEDGTKSSRRRVATAELDPHDRDDASAKTIIMAQDQKIAQMSGNPRAPIKSITRSE